MKIDFKSLLVGLLFGIVVAFSIAANGKDEPQVGRFEIAVGPGGDFNVLDTTTGQVWSDKFEPKLK